MLEPIITFEARREWFGVLARDVREVARLHDVRPVPRAPGVIAGLAEVHGRVVTLLDLERLVPDTGDTSPGPSPAGAPGAIEGEFGVVLSLPYEHLALLVRGSVDVAASPDDVPASTPGAATWLQARLPMGARLLNLLSLPALVSRVEATIRKGFSPDAGAGEDEEG